MPTSTPTDQPLTSSIANETSEFANSQGNADLLPGQAEEVSNENVGRGTSSTVVGSYSNNGNVAVLKVPCLVPVAVTVPIIVPVAVPVVKEVVKEVHISTTAEEPPTKRGRPFVLSREDLSRDNKRLKITIQRLQDQLAQRIRDSTIDYGTDLVPDESSKDVIRDIRLNQDVLSAPTYSTTTKQFAAIIKSYSAPAYDYLRNFFGNALPHPRTVERSLASLKVKPGIIHISFKIIRKAAAADKLGIDYCLDFDEMAIKAAVETRMNTGEQIGLVDGGELNDLPDVKKQLSLPARTALTFMAVAASGRYIFPVAVLFLDHNTADIQRDTFCHLSGIFRSVGANVITTVADGLKLNITTITRMGVPYGLEGPYQIPGTDTFCSQDMTHNMKLLRKYFATLGYFMFVYRGKIYIARWEHIVRLVKLQDEQQVRFGNRLTSMHLNWRKWPMKAKLALQVFSRSVADTLKYLRESNTPGFEDSEGTEMLCRVLNDLWDCLNQRSTNDKLPMLKQGVSMERLPIWREAISDAVVLLKTLKDPSGTLVSESPFKTGVIGSVIAASTAMELVDRLLFERGYKYVLTYYFLQDPLEQFFGYVRYTNGCNNNPSVSHFLASTRSFDLQQFVPERETNVQKAFIFNRITIFDIQISSAKIAGEDYDEVRAAKRLEEMEKEVKAHTKTFLKDVAAFNKQSEYQQNVSSVVSGFVSKLMEIHGLDCENCLKCIFTSNTDKRRIPEGLLNAKDYVPGALRRPSVEMYRIGSLVYRVASKEQYTIPARHDAVLYLQTLSLRAIVEAAPYLRVNMCQKIDPESLKTHGQQLIENAVRAFSKIYVKFFTKYRFPTNKETTKKRKAPQFAGK